MFTIERAILTVCMKETGTLVVRGSLTMVSSKSRKQSYLVHLLKIKERLLCRSGVSASLISYNKLGSSLDSSRFVLLRIKAGL